MIGDGDNFNIALDEDKNNPILAIKTETIKTFCLGFE